MRQWTIDAFTSRPFGGNSACVLEPFDSWPSAAWMQSLASENHAGATAFLVRGAAPNAFSIRWFTAAVEVPLCGHASLAAAHALWTEGLLNADQIDFDSPSGPLSVRQTEPGYELDFPAQLAKRIEVPSGLAEGLGIEPTEVWAGPYLVALLDSEAAVRSVNPDFGALRSISLALGGQGNVGVASVADRNGDYDVVDRFFAPGYGIPEDPATGSFHCILAPIMATRLSRDNLRFHQASPGRGADLTARVSGSRVALSGRCVTVLESVLRTGPEA